MSGDRIFMNALLMSHRVKSALFARSGILANKRLALPLLLTLLIGYPVTQETTVSVLADAYFQVAAFVFASLAVYYLATFKIPASTVSSFIKKHPRSEVAIASILGALPGCGGAIIVVTQYTQGLTSFGAVVAVLTSTMGDAAFLLLAQSPVDGITVMLVGTVVGTASGFCVNTFHNYREKRFPLNEQAKTESPFPTISSAHKQIKRIATLFWLIVSIPSLVVAFMMAFQLPVAQIIGIPEALLTHIGALLCFTGVALWSICGSSTGYASITKEDPLSPPPKWQNKAALDTQFVLSWVVVAFLLFELPVMFFGVDLAGYFETLGSFAVFLGILVGFLPGCGPQILVTNLYLNDVIPFSAQLGNAISNDGDALFPAIALSPKAAILATFYSAIPAFLAGYGYLLFFE